jgi:hypothetical protein
MTLEELASEVGLPLHKAHAVDARAREVVGKPLAQCSAGEFLLLLEDSRAPSTVGPLDMAAGRCSSMPSPLNEAEDVNLPAREILPAREVSGPLTVYRTLVNASRRPTSASHAPSNG